MRELWLARSVLSFRNDFGPFLEGVACNQSEYKPVAEKGRQHQDFERWNRFRDRP